MSNCIIAQSGGPTAVINSSVVGLLKGNKKMKAFDNVYGGLNGIEGILERNIINLSEISDEEISYFRFTPSSGLGSCRYKLKDPETNEEEYDRLMKIFHEYDIKAFFYVGGNDSMDTTAKLNAFAKAKNIDIKFFGIPKTIDNDLMHTDHTPGFGSAAKFISTAVLETYLDSKVYTNNGIFIIETMGRDTGWLAASGALATINGNKCADLVYLPERVFSVQSFLTDVARIFKEKKHVYIVASEGLKDENGKFLTETAPNDDSFGHAQLGGVGAYLKNLIIQASITHRVKSLELNTLQRCSMHASSKIDVNEAVMVGQAALEASINSEGGYMVAIRRDSSFPYKSSTFLIEADKIANNIKYFPSEWINEEGNNITEEGLSYLKPLISDFEDRDSLPLYHSFVL